MSNTKYKKYFLKIYGCLFNYSDADRIRATLNAQGYIEVTTPNQANIVISITCSVREKAEHRAIYFINKMAKQGKQTFLTGCMVRRDFKDTIATQTQKRFKRLKKIIPNTTIFDITNLANLPILINATNKEREKLEKDLLLNRPHASTYYDEIKPVIKKDSPIATIPIMIGCNEMCTYCVVPKSRGEEKYRSYDQIMEEVIMHLKHGKKFIYLLGQIVDKWKDDRKNKQFHDLLNDVANLPYDFILSFTSPHPNYITTETLKLIGTHSKIAKHLGLPLQSGSNRVLKAMNRKYTIEKYKDIATQAKKLIPNLYLTTDLIVGFPPEDETDFQETLKIVQELKFDKIFMAKYSPRSNLHANLAHDYNHQKIMAKRFSQLEKVANKIFAQNNKKQIGKTFKTLILSPTQGLTIRNQYVDFLKPLDHNLINQFINIQVIDGGSRGIVGKLT